MARIKNRGSKPAQPYGAPPPKSPLATGIAIIGWVGAGIILLAIMNSTSSQKRAQARIRMAAAEKQKVVDDRLAELQKAADIEDKKMRKELVVLKSDWETINKQRKKLAATVSMLERRLPTLRQQAEGISSAPVIAPRPAAPAPKQVDPNGLPPGFDPLGPKLPIGHGRPSPPPSPEAIAAAMGHLAVPQRPVAADVPDIPVAAVNAVFDAVLYKKLLAERDDLKAQIAEHRGSTKSKFMEVLDRGRGPQLHAFYRSAAHTPYGAAALFFAGERYYEDGKLIQAAAAYRNCNEQYPGSPYAATIEDRIDQVMDKDRFRRGDADVVPYVKP